MRKVANGYLAKLPVLLTVFFLMMPFNAYALTATWSGNGDDFGGSLPANWNIDVQTTTSSDAFSLTINNGWLIHLVGWDTSGDFHRFYCDFSAIYGGTSPTINFANAADFHTWVLSTCIVSYSATGLTEPDSLIQWSYSAGVITMNAGAAGLQFDNTGTVRAWQHEYTLPSPTTVPDAPTSLNATTGDSQISVAFSAPSDGGAAITDYEYQLDGGSWVSAGTSASPVTITGLTNGTQYSVRIRAVNSNGAGAASSAVLATPGTPPSAPSAITVTPENGGAQVAFTPPSDNGGNAITNYEYQLDGGSWISAGTTTSPFAITGLTNATNYTIRLRAVSSAGAGTPSQVANFATPSPESSFEGREDAVRTTVAGSAERTLHGTIQTNRRMVNRARDRFARRAKAQAGCTRDTESGATSPDCDDAGVARNVAPDIFGALKLKDSFLDTRGTFFGQVENPDGTRRRLIFGDFDIQHDGATDATTATLSGRVAWERMISQRTMLGYFVGAELSRSNISGTFNGDQNSLGATIGGYGVHELRENVYVDGFLTFGIGRNALDIADATLALEGDYTSHAMTLGGAMSGVIDRGWYQILPELSFSYGETRIGDVGLTGREFGLVDNTLVLDAGSISVAQIAIRPEARLALDGGSIADSRSFFRIAPRLICQQVRSSTNLDDCGAGAEFAIEHRSKTGLVRFRARVIADRIGDRETVSYSAGGEVRF